MQVLRVLPRTSFLIVAALLVLTGCKLEIRVPQGGMVVSTDGAYICQAGQTCEIDVVDLFFDQTFIAQPATGYYFNHWKGDDHYLCGGETGPCALATAGFEGHPALQALLESDQTFYLEPKFIWSPVCPPKELVISPAPMQGD
jgi:hypothetical protein